VLCGSSDKEKAGRAFVRIRRRNGHLRACNAANTDAELKCIRRVFSGGNAFALYLYTHTHIVVRQVYLRSVCEQCG
jgi:hypothetical protein